MLWSLEINPKIQTQVPSTNGRHQTRRLSPTNRRLCFTSITLPFPLAGIPQRRYVRYAPLLYRRFPDKVLLNSSTPEKGRLQLILRGPGLLPSLLSAIQDFSTSVSLGFVSPVFILAGNLAFAADFVMSLLARIGIQSTAGSDQERPQGDQT